jgi:hypothetical protein
MSIIEDKSFNDTDVARHELIMKDEMDIDDQAIVVDEIGGVDYRGSGGEIYSIST